MNQSWVNYLPGFVQKRLDGRLELQKVLGNTSWLFADRILRMGIGLIVGVWIARYLGPSEYGLISYAASLVAVFTAIATLGLDSIVVRELVRYREEEQQILGTVFLLRITAGVVAYLLIILAVFLLRPQDRISQLLVAVMGWVLVFGAFDTIDLWFQSHVLSKYVVLAKNTAFVLASMLRVVLVVTKASVVAFAVANAAEIGLGAVGLVFAYRTNRQRLVKWRTNTHLAGKLLRDCWPLVLSGIVFMIYLRIDQVMLGQLADPHEVGIYASAVKIAEIWFFIPSAIVSSVFPNIVRARENDEKEFYARLQKLYNLLTFIGYAIAIPTTCLASLVVYVMYGKAYAAAAPMLILLIWSDVFANLSVARNAFLMAMNWTKILFLLSVAGAVVNVLLNYFLIPRYGGVGAAAASLGAYWFVAHGACYFFKPVRRTARMIERALLWPRFW